jgi:hypothetical protein
VLLCSAMQLLLRGTAAEVAHAAACDQLAPRGTRVHVHPRHGEPRRQHLRGKGSRDLKEGCV